MTVTERTNVLLLHGVYPYRSVWAEIRSPVSKTGTRLGELSGGTVEPVFTARTPIRPVGGMSYPDGGVPLGAGEGGVAVRLDGQVREVHFGRRPDLLRRGRQD
ncbi:hypothetical protein Amsp01_096890 [Amycolatopsis sp. NBRC 101858]|nr:hypothetical protein Amsp01_096890 [Amycolatopsis sp. NBRC 101858]